MKEPAVCQAEQEKNSQAQRVPEDLQVDPAAGTGASWADLYVVVYQLMK